MDSSGLVVRKQRDKRDGLVYSQNVTLVALFPFREYVRNHDTD